VLGAGILEQVVGEVHKNVLKTMLCSYFTKNNRLSLYLLSFRKEKKLLNLKPESVYYKKHYKEFYKSALSEIEGCLFSPISGDPDHERKSQSGKKSHILAPSRKRAVIVIDLENFYDNIQHQNFLKLLEVEGNKNLSISLLLQLICQSPVGLHQTCNDVVASHLSWLYLLEFDNELREVLKSLANIYFHIYRYCDDTHIFIDYLETEDIRPIVASVMTQVREILYKTYKLKMNSKSIYYDLHDEEQRKTYQSSLKNLSQRNDESSTDEEYKSEKFEEWKKLFVTSVQKYLTIDLIRGTPSITDKVENLRLIYDNGFRKDLINHWNSQSDTRDSFDIDFANPIRENSQKYGSTHCLDNPKLFAFLSQFKISNQTSPLPRIKELSDDENTLTSLFLLAFAFEYPNNPHYIEQFKGSSLYRDIQAPSTEEEYPTLKENNAKNGYLSLFTLQRRVAEVLGNYAQATSFLNSEVCVWLSIHFDEKPKISINDYHKCLNDDQTYTVQFPNIIPKQSVKNILYELGRIRNALDISHNKSCKWKDLDTKSRTISESDYKKLKNMVFEYLKTL
jgi:hypothetical protein